MTLTLFLGLLTWNCPLVSTLLKKGTLAKYVFIVCKEIPFLLHSYYTFFYITINFKYVLSVQLLVVRIEFSIGKFSDSLPILGIALLEN